MAIVNLRSITPGQRFLVRANTDVSKVNAPNKRLTQSKLRISGRNCDGRITMRRRGGCQKRLLRVIDFRSDKINIPAIVERIPYDPNRSANIALLKYADGEKLYILATEKMSEEATMVSSNETQDESGDGMALPLF